MSSPNDRTVNNGTFYGSMVSSSYGGEPTETSKLSGFSAPTAAKIWGLGLLFVTIISFSAAIGIALMPLLSKRTYNRLLVYFVGLGVGSLSGSAIFHLLPEAFDIVNPKQNSTCSNEGDSPSAAHAYLFKCWVAIGGIYLFFLMDKFIKLFTEWKKVRKTKLAFHKHQGNGISNGHISNSSLSEPSYATITNITTDSTRRLSVSDGTLQDSLASPAMSMQISPVVAPKKDNFAKISNGACGHDHAAHIIEGQSVIATVAWMVIFGDGLHNFVDGLSIGAAFTENILSGISISVAVICEEFPHELGDVAILISSGMSLRQALFYNLLSAFTCYLGFIIGVLVGELSEASVYIFAFAGGMFLYISLGNMVPEMNNVMEKALGKSVKKAFYVLLVQSAGILTGLMIMFIMSYFGDKITFS